MQNSKGSERENTQNKMKERKTEQKSMFSWKLAEICWANGHMWIFVFVCERAHDRIFNDTRAHSLEFSSINRTTLSAQLTDTTINQSIRHPDIISAYNSTEQMFCSRIQAICLLKLQFQQIQNSMCVCVCVYGRQKDKRKSAGVRKHKYPCKHTHTHTVDHIIMYKISMLLPVCVRCMYFYEATFYSDQHMHYKILYLNAIASRMDKKMYKNSYEIP